MNLRELKNLLKTSTEENIGFDEPHVSLRCKENNITKDQIIYFLLHETKRIRHFIKDRKNVYKLYFNLNKKRQLKIIAEIKFPKKIIIRTVKILDRKLYKDVYFIAIKVEKNGKI
jgi:hypothetical protein